MRLFEQSVSLALKNPLKGAAVHQVHISLHFHGRPNTEKCSSSFKPSEQAESAKFKSRFLVLKIAAIPTLRQMRKICTDLILDKETERVTYRRLSFFVGLDYFCQNKCFHFYMDTEHLRKLHDCSIIVKIAFFFCRTKNLRLLC